MNVTIDDVEVLARMVGLEVPEQDLPDVAARLSLFLLAIDQLEDELGEELLAFEPVPPVYPREEDWDLVAK